MAQRSEKFFIFTWKELTVMSLMAIVAIGFFFTLGLHYGKKIHGGEIVDQPDHKLGSSPENLPSKEALEEAARHALVATEDTLNQATQNEVRKSKLKIDTARQVDLPKDVKPAKSADHSAHNEKPMVKDGKYFIQVGSFPNLREAQARKTVLEKRDINATVKTVRIGGTVRYRVVVPGFESMKEADFQGNNWKKNKKIEAFVVIKGD